MKINSEIIKQKRKHRFIILGTFIGLILILFLSETLWNSPLFDTSLEIQENLQANSSINTLKFMEIISIAGTIRLYLPIIIISLNFVNVYKSLIMSIMYIIPHFITGLLKFLYQNPRPYWINPKITIIGCEMGYGNPSGHSMSSMAFYLTLWHLIFDCSYLKKNKIIKYSALSITALFILLIALSRLYLGAHSINQVIFGGSIGFLIYFFTFYVICVEANNNNQFRKFISIDIKYFTFVYLLITFVTFLYFFLHKFTHKEEWEKTILLSNKKCYAVSTNRKFENESLLSLPIFISSIFIVLGIQYEILYVFKGDENIWIKCNFKQETVDDESLLSTLTISKDTQWNHTNLVVSIVRLIVIFILNSVALIPFLLVSFDNNLYVVLIFKVFIPYSLMNFISFFVVKYLCKQLRLVNIYVHSFFTEPSL